MVSDRSWHNGLPRFGGRFKEIRLTQSQPGEDHVLRIGPMSLSGQGFRAGKVKNDPKRTCGLAQGIGLISKNFISVVRRPTVKGRLQLIRPG
jgi:hypothetical protein